MLDTLYPLGGILSINLASIMESVPIFYLTILLSRCRSSSRGKMVTFL